jgi:membrane protein DedA with SNARE-associated domain
MDIQLLISNLTNPTLLFFILGIVASTVKTDLESSNDLYEKYGIWAFIAGRFMPVIRTMIPVLTRSSEIPLA